jgi:hypothetical protein
MNEPEMRTETTPDFVIEDLQAEVQALRTLLSVTLIVLLVFSFCINWYIFRQASMARSQVDSDKKAAEQIQAPAFMLWNDFVEYSKTHPDFAPIIEKYRQSFPNNPPAAAATRPK